jgi:predicted Zn-dependent protease
MNRPFTTLSLAGVLALASIGGAADSPVQAQSGNAIQPFSQAEKNQGAQAHAQIMQEFGGAYDGPQAAYVRSVGQGIAVQSGLSSARTDFTVTLLNSPVNNAFALPGGYVYVTRQLMALMNSEAELAGVLGHEVGHTAARHARSRQRAATRNSILGVLGAMLGGAIGDNGGLLGGLGGLLQQNSMRAAQLATLGFSRSQETQADDLGIRYLQGAGYDPMALSTMLASLAAQNSLDVQVTGQDARNIPAWASTHPDPASRVRRAQIAAQRSGVTNGRVNRDQFLTSLDTMLYADDPRQGVVEGSEFLHPDLRLRFAAPQGFGMTNGTMAVSISGSSGQAQFTTLSGTYSGNLDGYVQQAFQTLVGQNQQGAQLGAIRRTTVNGIAAAYAQAIARGQQGDVEVTIFAYEFAPNQAFHFAALAPSGRSAVFDGMFGSVRRLTANEAAAIRPRRIAVVTVGRRDTVQSLASRMAYPAHQLDRFLVLNGLTANAPLTPGQRVKLVVYSGR